jgi:EAL domain-containing protein (putative c-di-GMP-specific phosphodiesterase class I)
MAPRGMELTNADVDMGFAREEFAIVFQPKVDLATGDIRGAEALARWYHHDLGELPPGVFLSFLERQGRAIDLTRFALTRGIEAASLWFAEGYRWPVHVNLSPGDLGYDGLRQFIEIRLQRHNLPPSAVRVELRQAEVAAMGPDQLANLRDLLSIGVTLALQGPSDATYRDTDETPVAEFQVRGTALLGLASALSEAQSGRLLGMLRAAKRMSRETTAIALETEAHVATARELGFASATGYAFARPMALEDFLYWAATRVPASSDAPPRAAALP